MTSELTPLQRAWHWFWCHVYPRGVVRDGALVCPVCGRVLVARVES